MLCLMICAGCSTAGGPPPTLDSPLISCPGTALTCPALPQWTCGTLACVAELERQTVHAYRVCSDRVRAWARCWRLAEEAGVVGRE